MKKTTTASVVACAFLLSIGCGSNESAKSAHEAAAPAPATPPVAPAAAPGDAPASASTASRERSGFIASSRKAALTEAIGEADTAQRELDVAGGDCQNACRALGSMDRAAGRLCALAQTGEDTARCASAKERVYSARDRVRRTCGTCPDVAVDRDAPIPSQR